LLQQLEANFTALGKETPPKVQHDLDVIAGTYRSLADAASSGKSGSQLKSLEGTLSSGTNAVAFAALSQYVILKCGPKVAGVQKGTGATLG